MSVEEKEKEKGKEGEVIDYKALYESLLSELENLGFSIMLSAKQKKASLPS